MVRRNFVIGTLFIIVKFTFYIYAHAYICMHVYVKSEHVCAVYLYIYICIEFKATVRTMLFSEHISRYMHTDTPTEAYVTTGLRNMRISNKEGLI